MQHVLHGCAARRLRHVNWHARLVSTQLVELLMLLMRSSQNELNIEHARTRFMFRSSKPATSQRRFSQPKMDVIWLQMMLLRNCKSQLLGTNSPSPSIPITSCMHWNPTRIARVNCLHDHCLPIHSNARHTLMRSAKGARIAMTPRMLPTRATGASAANTLTRAASSGYFEKPAKATVVPSEWPA